jgi:hypothetical protein
MRKTTRQVFRLCNLIGRWIRLSQPSQIDLEFQSLSERLSAKHFDGVLTSIAPNRARSTRSRLLANQAVYPISMLAKDALIDTRREVFAMTVESVPPGALQDYFDEIWNAVETFVTRFEPTDKEIIEHYVKTGKALVPAWDSSLVRRNLLMYFVATPAKSTPEEFLAQVPKRNALTPFLEKHRRETLAFLWDYRNLQRPMRRPKFFITQRAALSLAKLGGSQPGVKHVKRKR